MRPTDRVIRAAAEVRSLSDCTKRKVGAVLFNRHNGMVYACGRNHTVSRHKCFQLFNWAALKVNGKLNGYIDTDEELDDGWQTVDELRWRSLHKRFSEIYEVHAEQDCLRNLMGAWAMSTAVPLVKDMAIYVTVEPCVQCSKLIVALGIRHVYFSEVHKSSHDEASHLFEMAGVRSECIQS